MHKYSLCKIERITQVVDVLFLTWFEIPSEIVEQVWKAYSWVSWYLGFEILMIKNKPKLENEIFLILNDLPYKGKLLSIGSWGFM